MSRKKIVVLSGAGISAESGIQTFRDTNGLWEGHDIMEVASPEGFKKNPQLVLDFYNLRRKQLLQVDPNQAHLLLKELEKYYDVVIITQNVDDLHERAGSSRVIHLHGELLKVRSSMNSKYTVRWEKEVTLQDTCPNGFPLRPDIVWFGEEVPLMETAISEIYDADFVLLIGTSLQVYPAAGLIYYAHQAQKIYYIDRNPSTLVHKDIPLIVIQANATQGVKQVYEELRPS